MDRLYKVSGNGFMEFHKRELGFSQPRTFSRHISASESLVKQIDLFGKLIGHEGCVNTVEFNSTGDHLVSGSDDKQIMFWEWATKTLKFSYPSGHSDNVFQARIMPFSDDRKIVTSSADGKVRLGEVLENGKVETKRLGKHQGRVHKLAVEPGSPYILYSCAEDGLVQQYDLRSNSATKLFYCSAFTENRKSTDSVKLNAIAIDPRNPHYFAVAGSDEYARVYDIRKYHLDSSSSVDSPVNTFCPRHLIETHEVHITALAYSTTSELLVSYNDELIYLFQKNLGLGPSPLSPIPESLQNVEKEARVYSGHRNSHTVKGVNFFGPNDEYVMSGSDCGHIFIWKKKSAKLVRLMVGDTHIVNQLEANPHLPVIATCGMEKNVKLWAPTSNDISPLPGNTEEIMEANRRGRENHSRVTLTPDVIMHVLRLHRRQALAYIERRPNREDIESDEDDGREGYVLGFADADDDDDDDSGEGVMENPRECNIS